MAAASSPNADSKAVRDDSKVAGPHSALMLNRKLSKVLSEGWAGLGPVLESNRCLGRQWLWARLPTYLGG